MMYQLLLVALCSVIVAHGNVFEIDAEEMAAIQERLAKYEGLEKAMKATFYPEESREEKCIPEGSECKFASGPNCCGIDTRCYIWGYQGPAKYKGGPANWQSICYKYRGGVWLKEVLDFFKNLG